MMIKDSCKLRHPDARFHAPLTFPLLGETNPGILYETHGCSKKEKCYRAGLHEKEAYVFLYTLLPRGNQDKGLCSSILPSQDLPFRNQRVNPRKG